MGSKKTSKKVKQNDLLVAVELEARHASLLWMLLETGAVLTVATIPAAVLWFMVDWSIASVLCLASGFVVLSPFYAFRWRRWLRNNKLIKRLNERRISSEDEEIPRLTCLRRDCDPTALALIKQEGGMVVSDGGPAISVDLPYGTVSMGQSPHSRATVYELATPGALICCHRSVGFAVITLYPDSA